MARGEARPDSDLDDAVHLELGTDAAARFQHCLRVGDLEVTLKREVDVVGLEEGPI